MKNIFLLISPLLFVLCFQIVKAQTQPDKLPISGKNLFKINLSGIVVNTGIVQYERVINKNQSIALTVGISPNVPLPFKETLLTDFGNNTDARNAIDTTKFTKTNITLEYRFYLSGKAPKGFYIAPFVRYMNMRISQDYTFTPNDGIVHHAHLNAQFNGYGAGILIGDQFLIGKSFAIDWWILGPFWGTQIKADFYGTDPQMTDMSATDRYNLKSQIEGTKLPLYTTTATIGETSVDAKLVGPYYGIRAMGICIAYRF